MCNLSVITPCFNVQKYIEECLTSVLNQIKDSFVEVIVVNDGSTDNTEEIIQKTFSLYSGIKTKYFSIENSGPSVARNIGVKHAQGKYIFFLDGDDVCISGSIQSILNILDEGYDIIELDAFEFYNNISEPTKKLNIINEYVNSDIIDYKQLESVFKKGIWFSCTRIYNKNLVINEPFEPGRRYEDMMLVPILYLKAKKITVLNQYIIGYRQGNSASITKNAKESDIDDIIFAMNRIYSYFEQHETQPSSLGELVSYFQINALTALLHINNKCYGYFKLSDSSKKIQKKTRKFTKKYLSIRTLIKNKKLFIILYFPALLNIYWLINKYFFGKKF